VRNRRIACCGDSPVTAANSSSIRPRSPDPHSHAGLLPLPPTRHTPPPGPRRQLFASFYCRVWTRKLRWIPDSIALTPHAAAVTPSERAFRSHQSTVNLFGCCQRRNSGPVLRSGDRWPNRQPRSVCRLIQMSRTPADCPVSPIFAWPGDKRNYSSR